MIKPTIILGGGITGLSLGCSLGYPIFEAQSHVGGICASYYIDPVSGVKQYFRTDHEEDYRFEEGGGHWIFGVDESMKKVIEKYSDLKIYHRKSAVFFPQDHIYIPYPIQNHLGYFPPDLAAQIFSEIKADRSDLYLTMDNWLEGNFGQTLYKKFFGPFNRLYTAGLSSIIQPQDSYKSPVNLDHVRLGLEGKSNETGYNPSFYYPTKGLGSVFQAIGNECTLHRSKRASAIDVVKKILYFEDGDSIHYERLISTIPLNHLLELTQISIDAIPDPYTSVLVVNIGGHRGRDCPDQHWIYTPESRSGFHRVGFYSNVDENFLPISERGTGRNVSMYVEKAYKGGEKPSEAAIQYVVDMVIKELQEWGYLEEATVTDATWIDVAYTWSYYGSNWTDMSIKALRAHDIYSIGRYGRWHFQGIAESIREGFNFFF